MGNMIDLTGRDFGMLKVIGLEKEVIIPCGAKRYLWKCECECGNTRIVEGGALRSERVFHCGRKNHPTIKHGKHGSRLYGIWKTMKTRCFNPNCEKYKNYGARGISVCKEWKDNFQAFYEWAMANGYKENLTIERTDVDGNYCPENCCWIPAEKQGLNKTSNVVIEFNGKRHILSEWSKIVGISESELSYRLSHGWSIEKALTKKVRTRSASNN